jgi:UPF0755 protein
MSDNSNPAGDGKPAKMSLFGRRAPPAAVPEGEPPPSAKRRRRSGLSTISAFLSFVLVVFFIALTMFGAALVEARRAGPLAEDKIVNITREDDGGPIDEQLERAGVIDSDLMFSAMTLIDGTRGALKRGEYAFKAHASLSDVEQLLLSGKVVQHKVTIPEGLTSDQIVQRLKDNDVLIGDVKEPPREGSLLPETYFFARGETRQALLAVMAKAQTKIIDDVWSRRAADLPIKSPGELATLASMIEKETGKADERGRVAGVFVNRLEKHMKLQSDPTIVYGLVFGKGTLGRPISKADLNTATPYNTYNIDGLPPGPICNPGKAALEAAASPSPTKELYFVADGTGGHAFAETLDQHLKNVANWRKIEQDAKDRLAPDAATPGAPPAPLPSTSTHGEAAPIDPKAFGALAAASEPTAKPESVKTLARKLEKVAGARRKQEAALGGVKALDELGAVVTGVNDTPETVSFGGDSSAAAASELKSSIPAYVPNPANRGKVFDASEGTPIDPLLNKTYDLSSAKDIPVLNK